MKTRKVEVTESWLGLMPASNSTKMAHDEPVMLILGLVLSWYFLFLSIDWKKCSHLRRPHTWSIWHLQVLSQSKSSALPSMAPKQELDEWAAIDSLQPEVSPVQQQDHPGECAMNIFTDNRCLRLEQSLLHLEMSRRAFREVRGLEKHQVVLLGASSLCVSQQWLKGVYRISDCNSVECNSISPSSRRSQVRVDAWLRKELAPSPPLDSCQGSTMFWL